MSSQNEISTLLFLVYGIATASSYAKDGCTALKDLKFFKINFEMDQCHEIVGVGNVLAAILCNIITIKFIFTKYEVVFIGTAVGVITFFLNLHRIMRRPTFFFTDKVSM